MKKLSLGILILFMSCEICNEKHITDASCFVNFKTSILKESTKSIDFAKQINCFEWDRLEIGERGSYERYPCTKFHQICSSCGVYLGKELEGHMGWLDDDRHWTFIYFYKNGMILNDALAIPEGVVSFDELKRINRSDNLFYGKENTEFKMTEYSYGGKLGNELITRQMLK